MNCGDVLERPQSIMNRSSSKKSSESMYEEPFPFTLIGATLHAVERTVCSKRTGGPRQAGGREVENECNTCLTIQHPEARHCN
jgi:hypothetical protein